MASLKVIRRSEQGRDNPPAAGAMALVRRVSRCKSLGSSPWIGSSHHRSARRRSNPWIILASTLWFGGCVTHPDAQSANLLSGAITIERRAVTCNRSITSDARYQHLVGLVPLAAPYQASVAQMTNTDRANDDEAHALTAWTQDIQKCRREVIDWVRQSSPISLALVLSAWADEDEVFVGVIQRKLSWGVAATRLRAIQIKLLSSLTDRAIQVDAQLSSAKQAELARRVAIFDAITNLVP
jgi:hypothetical protein